MLHKIIVSAFVIIFSLQQVIPQEALIEVSKSPVSSDRYDEFSPVFYGKGIVFVSTRGSNPFRHYSAAGNISPLKIYYADTAEQITWKDPELFSKELTSRLNDGPVTFSRGGDTIYYSRNQIVDGSIRYLTSIRNNLGLFFSEKRNGKWAEPREFRHNIEWNNMTTPSLSPDGERLYFAADIPGGFGGADLYYSDRRGNTWSPPVNMGAEINTAGNESYPYKNNTGEFYFASDGHSGMGGKDIFVTVEREGKWLSPVALPSPINSEYDDFGIITDLSSNSGYFSSDRDRTIDIYSYRSYSPLVWFPEKQKENLYCYSFREQTDHLFDTTQVSYKWSIVEEDITLYGDQIEHCFSGPGKYTVHLDIIDSKSGKLFFSKSDYKLEITDHQQPYITMDEIVQAGTTVRMNGMKSNFPGYTPMGYFWKFTDGTSGFGESVNYLFNRPGEQEVMLGMVLKSDRTGEYIKSSVTKTIEVLAGGSGNPDGEPPASNREMPAGDIAYADTLENIRIISHRDYVRDITGPVIFQVVAGTGSDFESIGQVQRKMPEQYAVNIQRSQVDSTILYVVDEQMKLMDCYPAFMTLVEAGFENVHMRTRQVTDQAERDLFTLKRDYGTITDTYFDSGNKMLTDSYLLMNQVAKILSRYPNIRLEIAVHTDDSGSESANLTLSSLRAKMLVDYLVSTGMERERLVAKGYGESRPIANNLTPEGQRLNRRIDIRIIR